MDGGVLNHRRTWWLRPRNLLRSQKFSRTRRLRQQETAGFIGANHRAVSKSQQNAALALSQRPGNFPYTGSVIRARKDLMFSYLEKHTAMKWSLRRFLRNDDGQNRSILGRPWLPSSGTRRQKRLDKERRNEEILDA